MYEFCQLVQTHKYQKYHLLKVASKHFTASYLETFGFVQCFLAARQKIQYLLEQAAKSDFGCWNRYR